MIEKSQQKAGREYTCSEPGCEVTAKFTSIDVARKVGGWGVSGDYKKCYCPVHAPLHRRGAAKKAKGANVLQLPPGWEQLKLI